MSAQILDGKSLASAMKAELTIRVAALKAKGITPGLGTVLVGDDPGSVSYVNGKHRDCKKSALTQFDLIFQMMQQRKMFWQQLPI